MDNCLHKILDTITQEQLAELLNVSYEHISKLERGKRHASLELIVTISQQFSVSTDYLLLGKKKEQLSGRQKLLDVITQLTELADEFSD